MALGIAGFLVLDRLGLRVDPMAGAGPVGLVLMSGALATLLAQWGVIPRLGLGPRAATLSGAAVAMLGVIMRSEEHTSELQSLMRISYAVFCFKKKNSKNTLH